MGEKYALNTLARARAIDRLKRYARLLRPAK
jgi:hypothetical protein